MNVKALKDSLKVTLSSPLIELPDVISWLVPTVLRDLCIKTFVDYYLDFTTQSLGSLLSCIRYAEWCASGWILICFPASDTLWLWTTRYVPQRSWTSVYSVKLVWGHVGKGSNLLSWLLEFLICGEVVFYLSLLIKNQLSCTTATMYQSSGSISSISIGTRVVELRPTPIRRLTACE